jgi:nitroreductase
VILECLRLAVQAPTASNSQGWRWVVVTDAGKRAALAEIYRSVGLGYLEAAGASQPEGQTKRVYESAVHLAGVLERVPVHVIPCVRPAVDLSSNLAAASAYASIIPAAWSFQLALRSRGLGSVWTTLHLGRERDAAELLGIPDDVTQVGLVPVAYTLGTDFQRADRPPVSEIVSWDRWVG